MPPDYFAALGYSGIVLALDPADLQKRYYARSRQLHPDRFARASAAEQQAALEASSVLNDAYRTLRDPVERAEYVLTRQGLDLAGQSTKDVPPELLEEVFELNMALEELKAGDASAREQIDQAQERFERLRASIDQDVESAFRAHDERPDPSRFQELRGLLNRRRYISNLIHSANHVSN
jgi:molecular chaperone HscB